MKNITSISLLLIMAVLSFGGDPSLALKSAVVPGMGQISAGSGSIKSKNTLKGLGIMVGFAFSLNGAIRSISEKESYAEQTQFYASQILANENSGTYEEQVKLEAAHKRAWDSYNSANTWTYIYLGLTAVFYGYGIADAFLYTKEDKKEGSAGLLPGKVNLSLGPVGRNSGIKVNYRF
jgi:hypothetical protein